MTFALFAPCSVTVPTVAVTFFASGLLAKLCTTDLNRGPSWSTEIRSESDDLPEKNCS